MKGYYSLEINRSFQQGCGFRYKVICNQYTVDEVDVERLKILWSTPRDLLPDNLQRAGSRDFLTQCNMKTKQLFEIRCHYPTAHRILFSLEDLIPRSKLRPCYSNWQNPIEAQIEKAEELLSFEEFLPLLQKTLNELPPKTFSKQNRQKGIESYMASV